MLAKLKNHSSSLLSILAIFFLFLAYNHTLVFNPTTALTDWLDYPLIVFILEHNIKHLSQLDFANFANIASFYPSPGGMFFSEILLVQGIIGTLLFPFTKNYILTHNLIFFLTALTNIIALQYFWSKLFNKQLIVSVLTLLFVFSPYYFSTYVHFQMIGYAFFFLSAGKVLGATKKVDYFWAGILSGLQFLAGVYLGIYSLVFTGIFLVWKLWKTRNLKMILLWGSLYTAGFALIAGYFLYMFSKIKNEYNIIRHPGSYVDLAMQPTDWLFNPYDSVWSRTLYKAINSFDQRKGMFYSPGWILLFSSITGMFVAFKKKRRTYTVVMLLFLGWGIIAALGPRLSINGHYYGTLLPYAIFLKFTPFFDALRATGRWFFIIQIPLLFFVGVLLEKLSNKFSKQKVVVLITIGVLAYALEIVPLTQRTEVQSYQSPAYQALQTECHKGNVLLEYPFEPQHPQTPITTSLSYWVKILLNQMHHDCYIVNGYSGFDPQHYLDFKVALEAAIASENPQELAEVLQQKDITFIKLNKTQLTSDFPNFLETYLISEAFEILYTTDENLVVQRK